jgi:ferredoxin-NADP reductase
MPESYTAVAERIEVVSPRVRRYFLRLVGGKPLVFKAGQFLMADLVKPDGTPHRRAYSIASPPHASDPLELVIKYEEGGVASNYFFNELKEGGSFPARAPFGAFVIKEPVPPALAFVATGTGIAPLRSMIHWLYHEGHGDSRRVWLFLGVRHETEILYDDEWRKLAAERPGFTYIPTISRPRNWSGETGYVQEKVRAFLPKIEGLEVYACGGDAMIKALGEALREKGYPKEALHYEIW